VSNRSADMITCRFPGFSMKHFDHKALEFAEFSS